LGTHHYRQGEGGVGGAALSGKIFKSSDEWREWRSSASERKAMRRKKKGEARGVQGLPPGGGENLRTGRGQRQGKTCSVGKITENSRPLSSLQKKGAYPASEEKADGPLNSQALTKERGRQRGKKKRETMPVVPARKCS